MVNFVAKWHLIWAQSIQEVKPKILILILAWAVLDNWMCPARARAAHYIHLNENRSVDLGKLGLKLKISISAN